LMLPRFTSLALPWERSRGRYPAENLDRASARAEEIFVVFM